MKRPKRLLAPGIVLTASLTAALLFASAALAQVRQFKVCVPDYSVGVMPFFLAKHYGYFAQEQMEVEVIAGRGNLCTMGLIAGSFQFTYSPSTFDAVVAGDIKGKTIYVAEKFLLHRFIVAPQIKRLHYFQMEKVVWWNTMSCRCIVCVSAEIRACDLRNASDSCRQV